jgi:hypothetical protein
VRDLRHQGIAWRVREMDATNIPGARADRCLIFDSESVVRRAWSFPRAWAELDDESIWALLERDLPAPIPTERTERRATARGDHAGVVTAVRGAASSDLSFSPLGTAASPLGDDDILTTTDAPFARVSRRRGRARMRAAVINYTATLKAGGTTPERSITLVKSAVNDGLEQAPECADHISKDLVDHAVVWCIRAYYSL